MPEPADNLAWIDEYRALTGGVGLVDLSARTQVELTGDDRAKFLHNLCTNDIGKLTPGAGCEAFLLDVKGHVLAHGFVFSGPESLVFETVPGQAEKIIRHLDRYLVREKVELHDRGAERAELLVSGPLAPGLLSKLAGDELPQRRLESAASRLGAASVWLRRVDLAGPLGYLVDCARDERPAVESLLREAGALPCGQLALEAARIEAGSPWYGQDISEKNLPQEVGRDAVAISFTKGCYLGQETVARIDALGHVNRTLVGVRFASDSIPEVGAELRADGQSVGNVTSATYSPQLQAPLALAYVRRGSRQVGTKLASDAGDAEVVGLPIE